MRDHGQVVTEPGHPKHLAGDGWAQSPGTALTESHRLGAVNSRNSLSCHSGDQMSEIKVSAGLVLSGGSGGKSVPGSSPSVGWPLAVLSVPWLVDASFQFVKTYT